MGDKSSIRDPGFRRILARRSRWRWSLSGIVIITYIGWALTGVYLPESYARGIAGTSIPVGLVIGYVIIALSIVLSVVYVYVTNRHEAADALEREEHR